MKKCNPPIPIQKCLTLHLFLAFWVVTLFAPIDALCKEPVYGGKLIAVHENNSAGYDALKGRSLLGVGKSTIILVMERLFEHNEAGELVSALGLYATESKDGMTWTIALRQGVKFHDDTPFNANAVVNHWQRLLNPENRYRGRMFFKPIESVEKTGEFEVAFHLKHPWASFTYTLSGDNNYTAFIPSPKAVADGTQHRFPVGTGPFMMKKWKPNDSVVVVKNPNYWKKGRPYLDEITLRVIPDHETRYAMLTSGQADIIFTDRPSHLKKLRNNPTYKTLIGDTKGATILSMNMTKPPFDDVRVRPGRWRTPTTRRCS